MAARRGQRRRVVVEDREVAAAEGVQPLARLGAPGPSGGSPRTISSWKTRWLSLSSACVRPTRSPKRRYIVPIPTQAAFATSCIETFSAPRSSNSVVAAVRIR